MDDSNLDMIFELAGFIGVVLYVGAYAALQLGLMRGATYVYALVNLAAAAFVLISMTNAINLYSAMIQAIWIFLSIAGIARLLIIEYIVRFTAEERAFLDSKLPALDKENARALMRAAVWSDGAPDEPLILEDKPTPHLIYLATGGAIAPRRGATVGQIPGGALIGEVTSRQPFPSNGSQVMDLK